jgi:DNA-binding beta-propeller fold protein YncE
LYVTQSGDVLKHSYSLISVVDTNKGEKVTDIKVEGEVIEDLDIEPSGSRIYMGNKTRNGVDVIDRKTHEVIAFWPLTQGNAVAPVALDEKNHRLFVGCRSGHIVIFDTVAGKELQALPINGGIDDLDYDPVKKRLYATCGGPKQGGSGSVDVFEQIDGDHYKSIAKLATGPAARNGLLVSEVGRFFVAIPEHDNFEASIQVYEVR